MSEEKALYGNSNYGESATIKTACLCENYSELQSVSEEMAMALEELFSIIDNSDGVDGWHLNGNIAEWSEFPEINLAKSAIEKFNKLKENEFQEWMFSQGYHRNSVGVWYKDENVVSGKDLSIKLDVFKKLNQ